jgi:hypothetical protein
MSLVLQSSGGGSVTLQEAVTASNLTITVPAVTGTMLTTATPFSNGQGPTFSAFANTSQTPSNGTNTKVNINQEFFDTASCFDTSNARFTPNVAGYYIVRGCLRFIIGNASSVGNAIAMIWLYKNGSEFYRATELRIWNNAAQQIELCTILYMNGTTDYIELYGRLDGTSLTFEYGGSSAYTSQFSAAMIRGE